MSTADEYPWTRSLVLKLLHNDPSAIGLFAGNPFPDHPPRFIRQFYTVTHLQTRQSGRTLLEPRTDF
jgi:hypothetical protein